ncbi:unnamed protein product [Polarella glacialis]|uniref:Uncharacterized protein n=1 Tax=Polarella glacialis TaxID=89957 RepID=A0A813DK24_POLGL|nr:unnamed protein product [Polarella glacialis]
MLELFKTAHRSKPGLHIKLLHGSSKLCPQMRLDILDQSLGCISLTMICTNEAAQKRQFAKFSSMGDTFAVIKEDRFVVSLGSAVYGGDSSSVADTLQEGVLQVIGNRYAFAAIKEYG